MLGFRLPADQNDMRWNSHFLVPTGLFGSFGLVMSGAALAATRLRFVEGSPEPPVGMGGRRSSEQVKV